MPTQTRAAAAGARAKVSNAKKNVPSPRSENDSEMESHGDDEPSGEKEGDKDDKDSEQDEYEEEKDGEEDEEEDELEEDHDEGDDPDPNTTQSHNARAPPWQPWQDRLLITQVNEDRPFLMPRRSRNTAWDSTANSLAHSSAQQGPNSYFTRTGEACKACFNILRKKYKVCAIYL